MGVGKNGLEHWGKMNSFGGKMEWCHIAPFHFAPQWHFELTYHVPFCPRDYVWRKAIMSTTVIISPVAHLNDVKMRTRGTWLYLTTCSGSTTLICQSNWCQNVSKLFCQNGEISFLWDTQNVVYCKFVYDAWRWNGWWQKSSGPENRPTLGRLFSEHPVFHLDHVPILPRSRGGFSCYVGQYICADQNGSIFQAHVSFRVDFKSLRYPNGSKYMNFHLLIGI